MKRKSDGEWIPVKPITDAYIINVGDVVQVLFMNFEHSIKIEYT